MGEDTGGGTAGSTRRRYRALDGYRFLAAAAIVLFHYNYDFRLGLSGTSRAFDKLYVYVDFFFVLSGFVIAEGYRGRIRDGAGYGRFLWKRLARIYPLHLLTLLALVAGVEIASALGRMEERPGLFDPSMLPQTLLLVHAWGTTPDQGWNLPSWSISAELFAYLAFPLLAGLAARLPALACLALAVAYVAAMQALRHALGLYDWTNATSDGAMRAVPTFFLGVAISAGLARARALPRAPWWLAHLLFLLPLPLLHLGLPETLAIALFPPAVLAAALAERSGRPTVLAASPVLALGQASYALYLLHFPVAYALLHALVPAAWLGSAPARWTLCAATLAGVIALSLACYRLFELPLQRRLAGLSLPGRRALRPA